MNLVSWLLFGIVLGVIAVASSTQRNVFTVITVGLNSILFGIVVGHTILTKGIFSLNFLPFLIAILTIIAFSSLSRVLKQV